MTIGACLGLSLRFCTYKRHYQWKHYVKSVMGGALAGAAYFPFFAVDKIDSHRMLLMLNDDDRGSE